MAEEKLSYYQRKKLEKEALEAKPKKGSKKDKESSVKKTEVYVVGYGTSKTGRVTKNVGWLSGIYSDLNLAYTLGLKESGEVIVEPNLSYDEVSSALERDKKVIVFDILKFDSLQDAQKAGNFVVIFSETYTQLLTS
jgi:hypothetical protein